MIEAIIFDMDGLLVDSELVWNKARADMAANVGIAWNKDDHKAVMGVSTQEWVDYMQQRLKLDMPPDAIQNEVLSRMAALYAGGIPFLPGAIEAVDLAAEHYPVALASGSHRSLIDIVTQDPALQNKFQVILSADEVGAGKPDPAVYLEAAKQLGIDPTHCLCLEDSGNGILSGKRAGMTVIAVPDERFPPAAEILAEADIVLQSLTEFSLGLLGA
ncbi:MAG: HAD family phosphatase [Anaerolineae bacterium]|nr:HAD family phosphatase [Anaerolineae bacterium]